jgi:hypothetical protein
MEEDLARHFVPQPTTIFHLSTKQERKEWYALFLPFNRAHVIHLSSLWCLFCVGWWELRKEIRQKFSLQFPSDNNNDNDSDDNQEDADNVADSFSLPASEPAPSTASSLGK